MAVIDTLLLNLKSTQSCDGKTLYITDITGVSSSAGDDKWGDSIDTTDIVKVVVTITLPDDGDSFSITMYDTTVIPNVTTWTPNTSGSPMAITYDLIGGTVDTVIPDGIYTIEYTMYTATYQILPKIVYSFLHSQTTCCIYGLIAAIDYTGCDCDYKTMDKALTAWMYYKSLLLSIKCGNFNKADRLLTIIQRLCNYSGTCNTCN